MVHITDICQVSGYVSLLGEHKVRSKKFNVNLQNRTCDCHRYQQTGIPCIHAIALIRHLKVPMRKQYFYEFCFVENLEKMFESGKVLRISSNLIGNSVYINKFATVLPNDEQIEKIIMEDETEGKHKLIPSIIALDKFDTTTSSAKRIRSSGEHVSSSTQKIGKRRVCSICNKNISKKTKHGPNACIKYYKLMHDGEPPLITEIVDY